MDRLLKFIVTCCLFSLAHTLYADTTKTISFENQKEEVFDIENFLKEITYIDQEVKDTCIRKVPYQENVCKDVTKYKKECETLPAHQECKQVNNPVCHNETKDESECHEGPGHQECSNVQVPVCHNETRYDNECSTTPSSQQCDTVYERECHYETRYENECHTVPCEYECRNVTHYRQECSQSSGGQECRTIPGDIQCHVVNGENRCVKIPPREECSTGPSRQECHQVPYQENECSTGPSRQECRQVPSQENVCSNVPRQQCRTIPGQNECHQVPRQEQVCQNETQSQCHNVPGEQICQQVPRTHQVCEDSYSTVCTNVPANEVCKDVPYKEQACQMETKYKDESYECTKTIKVPKETLVKTHQANVKVAFTSLSEILGPDFIFALDTKGNITLKSKANVGQEDDDLKVSIAAAFVKKTVKNNDQGKVNSIKADYKVLLLNKNEYLDYLETSKLYGTLSKYSFSFRLSGKTDPKRSGLALQITNANNHKVVMNQAINSANVQYAYMKEENYTLVTVDLKATGVKVGGLFTNRDSYAVSVDFSQDYSDAGEMVLAKIKDFHWKSAAYFYIVK